RLLADARVAFSRELLRVVGKLAAPVQRASELRRVEAFERTVDALVGLDAAAAVHWTPRVGVFQIDGIVRAIGVLVLQPVELILIERLIPGSLNEAAARRVIVRGRQRQARASADRINRLHQRLAERRLADDVSAIVILQRARDDLRGAGAV